ncbi:unnamed protein product [Phaedon cochleariae]|uniref:Uncharacterized protein n=1 Tax=Phaedon cochleariae TaxID=80249 RepID=A0A9N9SD17_PHACE|nr:unnamed protein product [Phaedon cochleariae]
MASTRQTQADFEHTLLEAFNNQNVTRAITEIIVKSVASNLAEKFKEYDNRIAQLEAEIDNLKSTTVSVQSNINIADQKKIEQKLDNIQQRTKRNNIRLMKVQETDHEKTLEVCIDLFKKNMKLDITEANVCAAYRVGKNTGDRPRHIVVVFNDNTIEASVYNKKKMLKGTEIILKEDLTAYRLNLMKEASETYGFKNVWSVNGNIFSKGPNGVNKISTI